MKIMRGAKHAIPGSRAWPRRDSEVDKEIGVRWDWGEKIVVGNRVVRNLVLQANKGATQEILRRMAGRDSHAKLMTLRLDLQDPIDEETFIHKWREGLKEI
jgi:hypothetical protein